MLTTDEISLETHLSWWDKAMEDLSYRMFIVEREGVPISVTYYMGVARGDAAWWGFYLTDQGLETQADLLDVWAHVETAGIIYPFKYMNVKSIFCEVRTENTSVLSWHKRFGFEVLPQEVSANTKNYDLVVKGLSRERYSTLLQRGLYKRGAKVDFQCHPFDD
ncbi:hypothetical protein [Pseudovibrio denitrificans]|nr:hypothetical protein [Pseudovibrio denitrificans]